MKDHDRTCARCGHSYAEHPRIRSRDYSRPDDRNVVEVRMCPTALFADTTTDSDPTEDQP